MVGAPAIPSQRTCSKVFLYGTTSPLEVYERAAKELQGTLTDRWLLPCVTHECRQSHGGLKRNRFLRSPTSILSPRNPGSLGTIGGTFEGPVSTLALYISTLNPDPKSHKPQNPHSTPIEPRTLYRNPHSTLNPEHPQAQLGRPRGLTSVRRS